MLRSITIAFILFFFFSRTTVVFAQREENSIVVARYQQAPKVQVEILSEMISQSMRFYIQQHLVKENGQLRWDKSASLVKKELESIVKYSVKYYKFKELNAFKGFSDRAGTAISNLHGLAFSDNDPLQKSDSEQELLQKEYIFFQSKVEELYVILDVELGIFSNENLYSMSRSTIYEGAPTDSLLRWIEYKEGVALEPQDIEMNAATRALLEKGDESHIDIDPSIVNNESYKQEVLRLVEDNSRQLEEMRLKMDRLLQGQLDLMEARQNETNQMLQSQINDLRSLVIELVGGNESADLADVISAPGSMEIEELNLPSEIDLFFAKNQVHLDGGAELILNEVIDILARNPSLQALITGSADKSGNPQVNLQLSKQRAQSVKDFIIESGISSQRLVTRYIGDSQSEEEGLQERKVTIEFIQYK